MFTMSFSSIDARIARLAAAQFGVITSADLRSIEVGRASIQRRVESGQLIRICTGVYAAGAAAQFDEMLLIASVRAGGDGAAVTHTSNVARRGLWARGSDEIHITTQGRRPRSPRPNVIFHTSKDAGEHIEWIRGVPMTSIERTCCDLGWLLDQYQIASVIHEATFHRIINLNVLADMLETRQSVPGTAATRRALQLHRSNSAGTRSRTEDRLVQGCLLHGLLVYRGDEVAVNTRGATSVRGIEADFVWRRARLVVEVDGAGHLRPGAREQDRHRDEALSRSGWQVLRFSARRVWRDLDGVCAQIRMALDH